MLSPDEIAQQRFLVALRGFDRDEVSQFLREVADEVRQLRTRAAELEGELARERREAGAPASDSHSAFRSLGDETTRILVAAEESASEIEAKAKAAGRSTLEQAQREARETTERANRQAARTIAEAERRRDEVAAELADLREERDAFLSRLRDAVAEVGDVVGGLDDRPPEPAADEEETPEADEEVDAPAVVVAPGPDEPDGEADEADPVVVAHGPDPAVQQEEAQPEPAVEATPPGVAAVTAPTTPPPPTPTEEITEQGEHAPDVSAGAPEAGADHEVVEQEATPTVASRRDTALSGLREAMSRRCKRGLQDVQNEVLASIREQGRSAELADLLPTEADLGTLASLGADQVEGAYRAALEDAGRALDRDVPDEAADTGRASAALATFREVLSHEVTSALRATLRAGLEAGEPEPQLSERVGEIFRDLRGPVLEGAVDEQLHRTYGLGLLDAWSALGVERVQWEVGHEARCPENRCRTNAGEGAVELGGDFPSGDRVPPAHPGCTCVLVPA